MSQPASKAIADTILLQHLPYELDGGVARRASIGLIVLATDYTIEHEWRQLFAGIDGVALYHSRIHNEDRITPDSLRAMQPRIVASTDLIWNAPSFLGRLYAQSLPIVYKKPPLELPNFTLDMCWHNRFDEDPAHAWFRGVVRDGLGGRRRAQEIGAANGANFRSCRLVGAVSQTARQ